MKIQIQNLSKIYKGNIRAIDNIDLEIGNGLFGLLGPNGAGKTTLMRILVTLMKPSEGSVTIDDFDLQKHRKEIRKMLWLIFFIPTKDFSAGQSQEKKIAIANH